MEASLKLHFIRTKLDLINQIKTTNLSNDVKYYKTMLEESTKALEYIQSEIEGLRSDMLPKLLLDISRMQLFLPIERLMLDLHEKTRDGLQETLNKVRYGFLIRRLRS
jgi:hypothetical protein